jgi:hypothetical protein
MRHARPLAVAFFGSITSLLVASGCGPSPTPASQYEVFECPAPIGKIVREDCSRSSLRWDGVQAGGGVGVGPVQAGASYKDTAIREADDLMAMLKEQRSSLCQDFNTCKLTVDQYRIDKERIESTATAVLAIRGNVEKISSGDVTAYLEEIRKIRSGGGHAAPTPTPPAPAPPTEPKGAAPAPAQTAADLDWRPGKYMAEAVGLVAEAAHNLQSKSEFGFDIDHGCLLGASIALGEIISVRQSMKGGVDYAILGGGASNTQDVDIAIMDDKGKAVAADTDDDATPAVGFKPPKDGVYEIKLQLAKTQGGSGSFVAMAILHKGGYSIPAQNLVQSIRGALATAAKASKKVGTMGAQGLVFHEQHDWSFFGTVLKPGERSGLTALHLTSDPAVVLAGADSSGTNIDLFVSETGTSRVVARDDAPDAEPLVLVHPEQGKRYDFQISNAAPSGVTLATAVVLDVAR